ncbi:C39 family peptidase [Parasporobacterium paucivorans]|uniref:Peptidase_C39 like family protein n=1 Tax=Parasporobacterium paucivorans DSM 15970 TaxID=1122934 RepID=A0A1M6E0N7_9FIRM|nr:C39 family peptidase [Parasporobacterium paucivorans]SHI79072.1 Peptidase_C39 like family protein [Parasporobacterium paucivorans DSM 15970]
MKNPLIYQSTEYDCGPTSMLNAISFLFHRKDISPDVIKSIMLYSLDRYNKKGEAYKSGTTGMAMLFLANWLNQFGKVKKWKIYCEVLNGEMVTVSQNSRIAECIGQSGAVVARVMLGCWHYVLITGIDNEYVYLFDPYYRERPFPEEGIEMIKDAPKKMNRKIRHSVLNSEEKGNYALGKLETRKCVLIYNKQTRLTMDSIEYII